MILIFEVLANENTSLAQVIMLQIKSSIFLMTEETHLVEQDAQDWVQSNGKSSHGLLDQTSKSMLKQLNKIVPSLVVLALELY